MKNRSIARFALSAIVLAAFAVGGGKVAFSAPIEPGFDLLRTQGPTSVDLGGPIGIVPLKGNPVGPGNTDTSVQRLNGLDPFNQGDTGTVPIELVSLSLVSVQPVTISGFSWDLEVTDLPSPQGSMQITHGDPNGGTFQVQLPVKAQMVFRRVDNPSFTQPLPDFSGILSGNGWWSIWPAPADQHDALLPAGGFYAGVNPSNPGEVCAFTLTGGGAVHTVAPANPEPGSLALFAAGLAGIAAIRRRRKKMAA